MSSKLLTPIQNQLITDQASAAIAGLLQSELSEKLQHLENLRAKKRPTRWWKREADQVRILQAEVAELALAYQKLENSRTAESVQAASYRDLMKLVGSSFTIRELQGEISKNCRGELDEANSSWRERIEHYNRTKVEAAPLQEVTDAPLCEVVLYILRKRGIFNQ